MGMIIEWCVIGLSHNDMGYEQFSLKSYNTWSGQNLRASYNLTTANFQSAHVKGMYYVGV